MSARRGGVCEAHGAVDCPACSRIMAEYLDTHGECQGCVEYARTGMHRKACPNRIIGGVETSRPVSAYDEVPPSRAEGEAGPLEKGRRKTMLIRKLAAGETAKSLATQFEVSQPAISQFRKRHAGEITQAKKELADNFAGLWVAEKFNRLAVLQELIEHAEAAIAASERRLTDERGDPVDVVSAREWVAELRATLKNVAEELGHLPSKVNLDVSGGVKINYSIVGVDMDALS